MAGRKIGEIFEGLDEDIKSSVYMLCGASSYDKFFVGAALNLLRHFKLLKKDEQEAIIFVIERRYDDLKHEKEPDDGHS